MPDEGFDALIRNHFSPVFTSKRQFRKIKDDVKRLILASSLSNSQGLRGMDCGPRTAATGITSYFRMTLSWREDRRTRVVVSG